jgi:hypothetical protein
MRRWLTLLFVLAVSLLSSRSLLSQDTTSITGIVTDRSGAVLRQATVTLTNPSTGAQYTTESNNEGIYRFNRSRSPISI